jgi:hypothetical protein
MVVGALVRARQRQNAVASDSGGVEAVGQGSSFALGPPGRPRRDHVQHKGLCSSALFHLNGPLFRLFTWEITTIGEEPGYRL